MEQVGMKINQSRSYQLAGCIDDAVWIALCRFSFYVCDAHIFNVNIPDLVNAR